MLRLDPNDPADRLLLKELHGEIVSFNEWLDAMEDLEDEPDCTQILQERGLRREDVLRDAKVFRGDFHARLKARDIPADDRFALCRLLSEQAEEYPSQELLRIYCEVLCGYNFLLDSGPVGSIPDDLTDHEEQMILQYLDLQNEMDKLLQTLFQHQELAVKFTEVAKQKRSPRPVSCDTERRYEIFRCFTAHYDLPGKGDGHILLDNIAGYIQIAAASPVLRSVEPLLLFRLLTRRQKYMCNTPDLAVDLAALWTQDKNKVDSDNGRNFKQYRKNLQFFADLCKIYEKDRHTDLPLCWYGLDQITVLGEFYRNEMSKGWTYTDCEPEFPFIPTVDGLVEDCSFSCFKNGQDDNVVLQDSELPAKELWRFQLSEDPIIIASLDRISNYMNTHAAELTNAFLSAGPAEVKSLCQKVLEHSHIRPLKRTQDLPLYLASINDGLMELQDYFANQYLIQAGLALTNRPLTKNPIPPE